MEKRSVIDGQHGPTIVKTMLFQDGTLASEITVVNTERGKSVTVGLGPKEIETLQRHVKELRSRQRSEKAKQAYVRRKGKAKPQFGILEAMKEVA